MRHFLPDEEKLKIKIANLPNIKHEKVELNDRLTFEEARTYFRYKDGKIYWIKKSANMINIGDEAGSIRNLKSNLHRIITLKRKQYLTGQIVFLLIHGYLPKYLIFIDGNTLNTNLNNLTAGNHSKRIYRNLKNVKTHLNLKGVSYRSDKNKYSSYIQVKGKTYYLGLYENIEIAKKAYNLAVKKLYGDIAYFND
jgi:hypothetical protein